MLFQSNAFLLVFLPVVLVLLPLARRWFGRWGATGLLLGASLVFYGQAEPLHLLVLLGSIGFNFAMGEWIGRSRDSRVMLAGVVCNLAMLAWFKYLNTDIAIPLGISFFTFLQIAYLVDVCSREHTHGNFADYALFVTFFPHLIAGPLVHHKSLIPQFAGLGRQPAWQRDLALGGTMFVVGLAKKVLLADGVAPIVDTVFGGAASGVEHGLVMAWLGAVAFSLQLYFDFSGYSDMALGLSRMVGLRLPVNFMSPFKAPTIADFWKRWHMTMTRFFTDYLYSPMALALTRRAATRRLSRRGMFLATVPVPTIVTFLVIGLWHGAGWTFILLGLAHGLALTLFHAWRLQRAVRLPAWLSHALTLLFVCATLVLFRADSLETAAAVYAGMVGLNGIALPTAFSALAGVVPLVRIDPQAYSSLLAATGLWPLATLPLALAVVFALPNLYQWIDRPEAAVGWRRLRPAGLLRWRPTAAVAVALVVMFVFAFWRNGANQTFLYFQF